MDAARSGVDWFVQRIAMSDEYGASPREIRCDWPYLDALHAHMTLDTIADVRLLYRKDAEAPRKKNAKGRR